MVVNIKEVTFIIYGSRPTVYIYDYCNNLIYSTRNNTFKISLKEKNVYKLIIYSNNYIFNIPIYIIKNKYIFSLTRTITFLLKDANYYNLPIKKGEIILV